jgi:hypothetical protein
MAKIAREIVKAWQVMEAGAPEFLASDAGVKTMDTLANQARFVAIREHIESGLRLVNHTQGDAERESRRAVEDMIERERDSEDWLSLTIAAHDRAIARRDFQKQWQVLPTIFEDY